LSEYGSQLKEQGFHTISEILQISIEDLEDIGLVKLGHQKRFLLAKKKAKDILSCRRPSCRRSLQNEVIYEV